MSPMLADFPVELVEHIFHFAAAFSQPFCITLSLVSSWTRNLATPHLLSTVIIKNHRTNRLFREYLSGQVLKPPHPDFPHAPLVRNLWTEAVSDRIIPIFEACENIEHLALNKDAFLWLIHASTSLPLDIAASVTISKRASSRESGLQLTMLSAPVGWSLMEYVREDPAQTSRLFGRITHLHITDPRLSYRHMEITHFTRLTHFAVPYASTVVHELDELDRVLELTSLDVLVVVVLRDIVMAGEQTEAENWVRERRRGDSRVFLVEGVSKDVQDQWEAEMRGGERIWERAFRYTREWEMLLGAT